MHEGFESFIGFNPWTALFTLLNMVITFLILKKFLFKPVNKMIDDRQKEIDDLYADAEQAKADAAAEKADYEKRLSEAQQTSAEMISSAAQEASRKGDEILRQARSEADAMREKATRDIELEKKKALNEAKDDLSRLAVDIAEKVVEKEIDEQDHARLIEDFLQNMGDSV